MATGTIMPLPRFTGFDANGDPVAGGQLFTYIAGTSTPVATYSDVGLTVAHANPIILNSAGRPSNGTSELGVYLTPGSSYKFVLQSATGATIWTQDNVGATPSSSLAVDVIGTAGEAIAANNAVYLSDGTGARTAGFWYRTDSDINYMATLPQTVGIATVTIAAGAQGAIRQTGAITVPGANFIPGATYYVDSVTGAISASTAQTFLRAIGVAQDVTTFLVGANALGAYLPLSGGTMVGDLKFTDGLWDIGKSGATRPRDLFLARNQLMNGVLTVFGFGTHVFAAGGAGVNSVQIVNSLAGAANLAQLSVGNDTNVNLTLVRAFSSTFTSDALSLANGSLFYGQGVGGVSVCAANGVLRFYAGGSVEQMRLDPTGGLLINAVTNFGPSRLVLQVNGAVENGIFLKNTSVGNFATQINFVNSAGTQAGSIQQNAATTVVYNTTSDRRLKDDGGVACDLSALRGVVVHDFTWKADGVRDRGVFAQDAYAWFPRAVSPGDDATTASGDLAHPWMTDYSKFVPDLIAGWQQHDGTLDALSARVRAIEAVIADAV